MKNILDTPDGPLSIHELQNQVREDITDFLKLDSDKEELLKILIKKYGSKNRKIILQELINLPSEKDRNKCKNLKWTMIALLLVSGFVSIFLYYNYGAPKIGAEHKIILIQILISIFLIYKTVEFTRNIFSIIQLMNIGKIILVLLNIVNGKYPEFIYAYLIILVSIHFVGFYIKRIGFDKYKSLL